MPAPMVCVPVSSDSDLVSARREGRGMAGRLGLGLPGVRHIMDEFDISAGSRCGTTITVTKWKRP